MPALAQVAISTFTYYLFIAMLQKASQRSAIAAHALEQREAGASAKPKLRPLRDNFEHGPDGASAVARHSSPTRLVEKTRRVRA